MHCALCRLTDAWCVLQVRAVNVIGTGEWSNATTNRTYARVPSQIGNTQLAREAVGSSSIRVSWNECGDSDGCDGGLPLTQYVLVMDEGCDGSFTNKSVNASDCAMDCATDWDYLDPSLPYCFTVAAVNREGRGPQSQATAALNPC